MSERPVDRAAAWEWKTLAEKVTAERDAAEARVVQLEAQRDALATKLCNCGGNHSGIVGAPELGNGHSVACPVREVSRSLAAVSVADSGPAPEEHDG